MKYTTRFSSEFTLHSTRFVRCCGGNPNDPGMIYGKFSGVKKYRPESDHKMRIRTIYDEYCCSLKPACYRKFSPSCGELKECGFRC